jgi:outer membrane protein
MGVDSGTDYDIQDEMLAAVPGEELGIEALLDEAAKVRPDLQALERQIAAQKLIVTGTKGGYGPLLSAGATLTEAGIDISNLTWNLSGSVNMTWPLFQGLLTYSQVKEAHATLQALEAQRSTIRQQIRVDLEQGRLQVRGARASLAAAGEALQNARERLRLAEARYKAGVGSIIELGDAQVAMVSAAAQSVQAEYNLASARALLLKGLGRLD